MHPWSRRARTPSACCVGYAANSRSRPRFASGSRLRSRTTIRRKRAAVSRSSSSARRSAVTWRRCSTRGNGNAPKLNAVGVAAREQVVGVDLVRPAEEVRVGLVRRRAEHREPQRRVLLTSLALRPLEVGEPFLERRTLCVTLAHRCHTVDRRGPVAQLVEQGTFNPEVTGSIPVRPMPLQGYCSEAKAVIGHGACCGL